MLIQRSRQTYLLLDASSPSQPDITTPNPARPYCRITEALKGHALVVLEVLYVELHLTAVKSRRLMPAAHGLKLSLLWLINKYKYKDTNISFKLLCTTGCVETLVG